MLREYCFDGCSSLSSVTCHWESFDNLKVLVRDNFRGIPTDAILYVPKGCTELYQNTEPWKSSFKFIMDGGDEDTTPKQCGVPIASFENGKLTLTSETEGTSFFYSIETPDRRLNVVSENGDIDLTCTYVITAYAYAENYLNSETVTYTLCFIDVDSGNNTAIETPAQRGIMVSAASGHITVSGLNDGEEVSLYGISGTLFGKATAIAGTATFNVATGDVVIVKIGERSIKVQL